MSWSTNQYKSVMHWQGWLSGLAQFEICISHFLPLNQFFSCFCFRSVRRAFLGLIYIILCFFFHCLRVCVFISRLMWHCWPVLTSLLLSQEKKLLCFYKCKKCSPQAQVQTHRHTQTTNMIHMVWQIRLHTSIKQYLCWKLYPSMQIFKWYWTCIKKQSQYLCAYTHTTW